MKIKERKRPVSLNPEMLLTFRRLFFDYDAVVTTYACRAGISVNGKDLTGMDAGQENSPGTKDGGLLGRGVSERLKWSDYSSIYGTKKKYVQQKNYEDVIEEYEESLRNIIRKRRMVMSILRRPRNPKIMMRCQNAMMMSQREMLTLNGGAGPIAPNGA